MAYVQDADGEGARRITFLYKMTRGACSKSLGTNAAALAGVADHVTAQARVPSGHEEFRPCRFAHRQAKLCKTYVVIFILKTVGVGTALCAQLRAN